MPQRSSIRLEQTVVGSSLEKLSSSCHSVADARRRSRLGAHRPLPMERASDGARPTYPGRALKRPRSNQQRRTAEWRCARRSGADRRGTEGRCTGAMARRKGEISAATSEWPAVVTSEPFAERSAAPWLRGVSLQSCRQSSSGAPVNPLARSSGWQRVDGTASSWRWLSLATQRTIPAGAAWTTINRIGKEIRRTCRMPGNDIRAFERTDRDNRRQFRNGSTSSRA